MVILFAISQNQMLHISMLPSKHDPTAGSLSSSFISIVSSSNVITLIVSSVISFTFEKIAFSSNLDASLFINTASPKTLVIICNSLKYCFSSAMISFTTSSYVWSWKIYQYIYVALRAITSNCIVQMLFENI